MRIGCAQGDFAKQHDLLPCRRQPAEAVGSVAVVRIPLAVDQGRTHHRQWRLDGGLEHQLAREVHGAVHGAGLGPQFFGQRDGRVAVDPQLRPLKLGAFFAQRCRVVMARYLGAFGTHIMPFGVVQSAHDRPGGRTMYHVPTKAKIAKSNSAVRHIA